MWLQLKSDAKNLLVLILCWSMVLPAGIVVSTPLARAEEAAPASAAPVANPSQSNEKKQDVAFRQIETDLSEIEAFQKSVDGYFQSRQKASVADDKGNLTARTMFRGDAGEFEEQIIQSVFTGSLGGSFSSNYAQKLGLLERTILEAKWMERMPGATQDLIQNLQKVWSQKFFPDLQSFRIERFLQESNQAKKVGGQIGLGVIGLLTLLAVAGRGKNLTGLAAKIQKMFYPNTAPHLVKYAVGSTAAYYGGSAIGQGVGAWLNGRTLGMERIKKEMELPPHVPVPPLFGLKLDLNWDGPGIPDSEFQDSIQSMFANAGISVSGIVLEMYLKGAAAALEAARKAALAASGLTVAGVASTSATAVSIGEGASLVGSGVEAIALEGSTFQSAISSGRAATVFNWALRSEAIAAGGAAGKGLTAAELAVGAGEGAAAAAAFFVVVAVVMITYVASVKYEQWQWDNVKLPELRDHFVDSAHVVVGRSEEVSNGNFVAPQATRQELNDAIALTSAADQPAREWAVFKNFETPEDRLKRMGAPEGSQVIPFSHETRLSGIDTPMRKIRRGPLNTISLWLKSNQVEVPVEVQSAVQKIASRGGEAVVYADSKRVLGVVQKGLENALFYLYDSASWMAELGESAGGSRANQDATRTQAVGPAISFASALRKKQNEAISGFTQIKNRVETKKIVQLEQLGQRSMILSYIYAHQQRKSLERNNPEYRLTPSEIIQFIGLKEPRPEGLTLSFMKQFARDCFGEQCQAGQMASDESQERFRIQFSSIKEQIAIVLKELKELGYDLEKYSKQIVSDGEKATKEAEKIMTRALADVHWNLQNSPVLKLPADLENFFGIDSFLNSGRDSLLGITQERFTAGDYSLLPDPAAKWKRISPQARATFVAWLEEFKANRPKGVSPSKVQRYLRDQWDDVCMSGIGIPEKTELERYCAFIRKELGVVEFGDFLREKLNRMTRTHIEEMKKGYRPYQGMDISEANPWEVLLDAHLILTQVPGHALDAVKRDFLNEIRAQWKDDQYIESKFSGLIEGDESVKAFEKGDEASLKSLMETEIEAVQNHFWKRGDDFSQIIFVVSDGARKHLHEKALFSGKGTKSYQMEVHRLLWEALTAGRLGLPWAWENRMIGYAHVDSDGDLVVDRVKDWRSLENDSLKSQFLAELCTRLYPQFQWNEKTLGFLQLWFTHEASDRLTIESALENAMKPLQAELSQLPKALKTNIPIEFDRTHKAFTIGK